MDNLPFPDLHTRLGDVLHLSDWITISQDRINTFADLTGDHQWIHIDPKRARKDSPYGTAIAHGFLTLSLLPGLMGDFFTAYHVRRAVNYGIDRLRFPQAVPAGARIRGRFVLRAVTSGPQGSLKCTMISTAEIEGVDRPACVADQIFLLFA